MNIRGSYKTEWGAVVVAYLNALLGQGGQVNGFKQNTVHCEQHNQMKM